MKHAMGYILKLSLRGGRRPTRQSSLVFTALWIASLTLAMTVFANPAHAACSNPAGVSGETRFNEDFNMLQYCDDTSWIPMYFNDYWANGVTFDGSTTELSHATAPAGVSDSKKFTASFWFRRNAGFGAAQAFFTMAGNEFRVNFHASNWLAVAVRSPSGVNTLNVRSTSTFTDTNWHHVMMSFDMSSGAMRHLYVDGISSLTVNGYSNDALNFTPGDLRLGADYFGTDFNGDIADFWIDFGTYIDLSDAANRAKFIDGRGKPVSLGADGSRVLGFAPDIFLSGDTGSWHTNKGTGGGFTENGALADALSSASDHPEVSLSSGLVGHWNLNDGVGSSTAVDSISANNATLTNMETASDWVAGKYSSALNFDGVDEHANTSDVLDMGTGDLSISLWFRMTSCSGGNEKALIGKKRNASGADGYDFVVSCTTNNSLAPRFGGAAAFTYGPASGGTDVTDGQWHHAVAVFDRDGYATTYLDGKQDGGPRDISAEDGFNVQNSEPVRIGATSSGAGAAALFFPGQIDDVRIYNRVLTQDEITLLARGCENPAGAKGTMIYDGDNDVMTFCDGRHWLAMGPAGDGGAGCTNPPGVAGEMVYNTTFKTMQYCEGDDWIGVGKGCRDQPGAVCEDGTVYAGTSSGNHLYTTPADSGNIIWVAATNAVNCAGTCPLVGVVNTTDGEPNTTTLMATDADTVTGGFQSHIAAQTCANLNAHGHDDWYLPAQSELSVLYNNRAAIGSFNTTGHFQFGWYWASNEINITQARRVNFSTGGYDTNWKTNGHQVRCVRK